MWQLIHQGLNTEFRGAPGNARHPSDKGDLPGGQLCLPTARSILPQCQRHTSQADSAGQITSGGRFGRFNRPTSTRSITTCGAFCKIRSRSLLIPTWSRSRLATWRPGRRWRRSASSGRASASALASVPSSPTRVTTSSQRLVEGCGLLFPVIVSTCCWIYASQLHFFAKMLKSARTFRAPCTSLRTMAKVKICWLLLFLTLELKVVFANPREK